MPRPEGIKVDAVWRLSVCRVHPVGGRRVRPAGWMARIGWSVFTAWDMLISASYVASRKVLWQAEQTSVQRAVTFVTYLRKLLLINH